MSDLRHLRLRPECVAVAVCPKCAGTGTILQGPPVLRMARCECPEGDSWGAWSWDGTPINPVQFYNKPIPGFVFNKAARLHETIQALLTEPASTTEQGDREK